MPVPTLLVATQDSISITDCDSRMYKILSSGDRPTDVTINNHEGRVYWLNEMQEIVVVKLDGTSKTKVSIPQIICKMLTKNISQKFSFTN